MTRIVTVTVTEEQVAAAFTMWYTDWRDTPFSYIKGIWNAVVNPWRVDDAKEDATYLIDLLKGVAE